MTETQGYHALLGILRKHFEFLYFFKHPDLNPKIKENHDEYF